ncbi:UDP-N-acetylmuramate dehydrogenase [Pelagibacterales bacterium SAG-MED31]|nr:UDP-N-acetylmuramate dehydrogenase [Pelagibacterales bacterium SAG-MED31]
MNDIIYEIQSKIKSKIFLDYDMGKATWFRTGGKTLGFVTVNNFKDLKKIVSYKNKIKYYIVGVGSNLLVRDSGYKGLIIKLGKTFNSIKIKKNIISVGAAVLDINLAKFASKNSIKDFEFFIGIPGTIGGAVKMNAGCYGSQTSDNLKGALILNSQGKVKYINLQELDLKYRSSTIEKNSVILKVDFNCSYSSYDEIIAKNNQIKFKREKSQPLREKTSGSTFKNPPGKFAAKLIENSGCKGLKVGGASVSKVHANFIINDGNATASDIEELGKTIIKKVKDVFGIVLEWEIKILGG